MSGVKVTILGSGTCVPSLTRSACAILIETEHAKILFDLGAGTMRKLLEAGIRITEISHLVFSHFHPDHTGEFVSFLFALKYAGLPKRNQSLIIAGSQGLCEFYSKLHSAYGRWIEPDPSAIEFVEMSNCNCEYISFGQFDIESCPVNHIESSLGYRLTTAEGISVVYSGDTDYCDSLVRLAHGADLFVCESAFPDHLKVKGHLTPSLAGRVAADAGVSHLILTHFYPECESVDLEGQCRRTYSGTLTLAYDLLSVELPIR